MEKTIKCLVIDSDITLISEIVEVYAEIGDPNCKLIKPYRYYGENDLRPWPEASDDVDVMIRSENILTIVNPKSEIIKKYLEMTE